MPNLSLHVNGENRTVELRDPDEPLLYALRNELRPAPAPSSAAASASAAPARCSSTARPVRSCTMPRRRRPPARRIVTVEGLGTPDKPHPVQAAFIAEQAAQCGYCTNGMVMSAVRRCLAHKPEPTREEAQQALAGNLCRCGSHERILRAVVARLGGGRLHERAASRAARVPARRRRARRRLRRPVDRPRRSACRAPSPRCGKTLDAGEVDGFLAVRGDGSVTSTPARSTSARDSASPCRRWPREELGIGVERIELIEGDTALTPDQGADGGQQRHHARRRADPPGRGDGARGAARACRRAHRQAGCRARHRRRRGAGESRRRGHPPRASSSATSAST